MGSERFHVRFESIGDVAARVLKLKIYFLKGDRISNTLAKNGATHERMRQA